MRRPAEAQRSQDGGQGAAREPRQRGPRRDHALLLQDPRHAAVVLDEQGAALEGHGGGAGGLLGGGRGRRQRRASRQQREHDEAGHLQCSVAGV